MAKRENILPYAVLGTIMQDNTGKRISKEAKETAAKILEELSEKIVYKANLLAEHNDRKTLKAKDIMLAYSQLKGGN